jgi:hypothetical protein
MRKALWLALAFTLLLAPAALAQPAPAATDLGLFPGGDCAPNATLADSGEAAALEELDLFAPQEQSLQPPACPTPTVCPTGCPPAMICLVGNLGQCCSAGGGFLRCCPPGQTIQVKSCACQGCAPLRQLTLSCV